MNTQYTNDGTLIETSYRENCKKCNGRGNFIGWSGQNLGRCFACDGVGYKTFKTAPEARQKARASVADRKVREATRNVTWFVEAYPAIHAWLVAKAPTFEFAASLLAAVGKFGELTEKQLEAAERMIAKDAARDAERAARVSSAPAVVADKLFAAFDKAKAAGLKYPKLRLSALEISPAGATSKNAGALYVKNGETYLGKIADGRFHASRDCGAEQAQAVADAMSDPLAAAVAYGKQTGRCCCCGRELTDPVSVERGIGPICEANFF